MKTEDWRRSLMFLLFICACLPSHAVIVAVVKTLPIYGKLYIYDTKYEARGRPIEFVKGTDQNNEISGSIASWNIVVKNRQVVYSPRRDYLGEDVFR